jgi:hypothetical protein
MAQDFMQYALYCLLDAALEAKFMGMHSIPASTLFWPWNLASCSSFPAIQARTHCMLFVANGDLAHWQLDATAHRIMARAISQIKKTLWTSTGEQIEKIL